MQAIVYFLYKECALWKQNFYNFSKLLEVVDFKDIEVYKSPLDIVLEDLEKKDPNHIAVAQYSIFKQVPAKTAVKIAADIMAEMFSLGYGFRLSFVSPKVDNSRLKHYQKIQNIC